MVSCFQHSNPNSPKLRGQFTSRGRRGLRFGPVRPRRRLDKCGDFAEAILLKNARRLGEEAIATPMVVPFDSTEKSIAAPNLPPRR